MILFPAFIAAIWIPAFVYRRRPLGFLIALLGPLPVMLLAWLIGTVSPSMSLMQQPWWLTLYGSVAVSIGLGAFVIACAPRRALAHECPHCHYDLRGNITGVCPECGRVVNARLLEESVITADDDDGVTGPTPVASPASDARAGQQAA